MTDGMVFPALSRRAETSGFLGFAAPAAAPIWALERVSEWAGWHYSPDRMARRREDGQA
jgi:hypothetical protein